MVQDLERFGDPPGVYAELARLVDGMRVVAMNYSPMNEIPYVATARVNCGATTPPDDCVLHHEDENVAAVRMPTIWPGFASGRHQATYGVPDASCQRRTRALPTV